MSVLYEIEKADKQIETEQDAYKRKKLQQALDAADNDLIEGYFDLRNFRVDDKGNHSARFPTRLGNLIDAYEHYPERVYGMESVFYWPRLWLRLDKDLKEDIDGRQALADSTVYVSFACFFNAAVWLVFTLLYVLNALVLRWNGGPLLTSRHTLFEHLPRWWALLLIMSGFLLAGFLVYWTSLRLHAQFGEIFKSVFDVFHDEITVSGIVGNIADYANDYSFVALPEKQRLEVAWRYLQFGLIRCPRSDCGKRIVPAQMRDHLKSHDIREKFDQVRRNDGETMHDHLKMYHDTVEVVGIVTSPVFAVYPGNAGRSYRDFMCVVDPGKFDGDIIFDMRIEMRSLEPFLSDDDWFNDKNHILSKLQFQDRRRLKAELIMYGRAAGKDNCDGDVPPLLPGWMESDPDSVLFDGQPINGQVDFGPPVRLLGREIPIGSLVSVKGFLALDCHAGDCDENDEEKPNVEIHPVYSIDILTNTPLISVPAVQPFAPLHVGESSGPNPLNIANVGTAPAIVSIPESPPAGANFVWDLSGDHLVSAGQTLQLQIEFTPSVIGPNDGEIEIRSNTIGNPHRILLAGRGVPGEIP
jgi:hypothetical protein